MQTGPRRITIAEGLDIVDLLTDKQPI